MVTFVIVVSQATILRRTTKRVWNYAHFSNNRVSLQVPTRVWAEMQLPVLFHSGQSTWRTGVLPCGRLSISSGSTCA